VPASPPAHPVIAPPPIVLPIHPPPPPPPVPVLPHAVGVASPLPNGVMVTFGADKSDLNPDTLAAIRAIAADALANPAIIVGITAWAPGNKDDPSTPRRLSLDRALAARAVLINAGLTSERIRAIAKGMIDLPATAPDRAEIVKMLPPPQKP
jgi:outer membrane protein OmpA-like peptidoglycan-associated protein